jgi:signal transduction histidine kinase
LLAQRYQGQLDANADRYIAFAVDGCTRMRTLIEDLLRYSRAGREVAFEQVEMFEIMDQVRRNLAAALKASGGSLQVDGELDSVIADKSQLIQVIENLVNNSLKYAKPSVPPEVQVSTSREPGSWRLQIADNGVGIPEEYRHTVFRIFQRLHGREIPGTGIGLAICRKVVERHHGTIEIGDSAYGGAQFTIVLPQREALGDA